MDIPLYHKREGYAVGKVQFSDFSNDFQVRCTKLTLGQTTHYLTKAQNASLFHRINSALSPNGVFVIDCPMATDEPAETTSFLNLVLWANSGGAAHSFEMYRGWLSDSGFRQIRQLSERWVTAIK